MAKIFTLPWADVGSGIVPSDGAKMNFYDTDTYNRRDTFKSADGVIPNANPVIADSTGAFPDIFTDGVYRVVLTDKNDVQIREIDGVTFDIDTQAIEDEIETKVTKDLTIVAGSILTGIAGGEISGDPTAALDRIHPVDSIIISVSSENPALAFGAGTWIAFGQGRILMGAGTSSADTNGQTITATAGTTRGEFNHTLTSAEMPAHTHTFQKSTAFSGPGVLGMANNGANLNDAPAQTTASAGSGGSHNNEQPSIVVYMWRRTA